MIRIDCTELRQNYGLLIYNTV